MSNVFFMIGLFISIHAPTRGATIQIFTNGKNRRFQSTLLQEERLARPSCLIRYPLDFNPRSYKRSDGKNAQLSLYLSVIIIA